MSRFKLTFAGALLFLGITNPTAHLFDLLVSIALTVYVGLVVSNISIIRIIKVRFLKVSLVIWPLIMAFLISSWINSGELRQYLVREPDAETYRTDMDDFLKTYYLMEKGNNYYTSFKTAVAENAFKEQVSGNLWSWRLPTVFYIWKFLPGHEGLTIYVLFLLTCTVSLYLAYATALPLVGKQYALLSPYLLYPYFHFAARDPTFLQTEWWGLLPVFAGIYFLGKKRLRWAGISFILAVVIRELFIVPILLAGIFFLIRRDNTWRVMMVAVGILAIYLILHSQAVGQQVKVTGGFLAPRFSGNKNILLGTFAFGSWEYLWYRIRVFLLFYVIGLIGLIRLIRHVGKASPIQFMLLSFYIFPLSFLFIGTSIYNDYWGIFYLPFVMTSVPNILVNDI